MSVREPSKIDFITMMNKITEEFHPTIRRGNTGVGATLEYRLGILENNRKEHDFIDTGKFAGIKFELKGKRKGTSSRVSLKTKSPHGGMTNQELLEKYGYKDLFGKPHKNLNTILHPNFGRGPKNKDWRTERKRNKLYLIRREDGPVAWYDLRKVGLEKLQNLIIVEADRIYKNCSCGKDKLHKDGKHEFFRYRKAILFFDMNWKKMYDLIDDNKLIFEFRLHKPLDKPADDDDDPKHDRGNVFRSSLKNIEFMYRLKQEIIFS